MQFRSQPAHSQGEKKQGQRHNRNAYAQVEVTEKTALIVQSFRSGSRNRRNKNSDTAAIVNHLGRHRHLEVAIMDGAIRLHLLRRLRSARAVDPCQTFYR